MNAAFLFDSGWFDRDINYAKAANSLLFKTGVVQASGRHMKMGFGDVLSWDTKLHTPELLNRHVYSSPTWERLSRRKLETTYNRAAVYAIVFHNMTLDIAEQLHSALVRHAAYLGALEVDFTHGPHLVLFRAYIGTRYRVQGDTCRIFYAMGDKENSAFPEDLAEARRFGFADVDWEDDGARGTIFDDYDTLEHFEQLKEFKDGLAPLLKGGADEASDLVFILEDLTPRLIWTLAAAFNALGRARNEEDIAQAAISGRRFLEQLADALFPARSELVAGRDVSAPRYRNRIWAFLAQHATQDVVQQLGKELDRLDGEFNAGLHSKRDRERLEGYFADLAIILRDLLMLDPSAARKPYYAHQAKIMQFFKRALSTGAEDDLDASIEREE